MSTPWTKERVLAWLDRADADGVGRAVVLVYNRQTRDEQQAEETKHRNGVGFNGSDARLGSYYAEWVLGGRKLDGRHLERCRAMLRKYCGQLAEEAEQRRAERAAQGNVSSAA